MATYTLTEVQRLKRLMEQAQRGYAGSRDAKQSMARQNAALSAWVQAKRRYTTYYQQWDKAGRPGAPLDPTTDGARAVLQKTLGDWGLDSLVDTALGLMKQGLDNDAIVIQLQQSDAYKKRFSANEERRKRGLSVLTPAEYLDLERAYSATARQFGLPQGFYDSPDDFKKLIAGDVSASEYNNRIAAAQSSVLSTDEATRRAWTRMYGLSTGDAIAMFLDPNRAMPLVQQRAAAAQIAGEGLRQGLDVDRTQAERLAGAGIDGEQARGGIASVAARLLTDQQIGRRFGVDVTLDSELNDELLGDATAKNRRRGLYEQEAGLFSGASGLAGSALNQRRDV